MTQEQLDKLIEQFHEDTGEYPPGELPEPETRCDAEIDRQIKESMPIWKAWCKGRIRGLEADASVLMCLKNQTHAEERA